MHTIRFLLPREVFSHGAGRVLDSRNKNPIMKSGEGGFTAPCLNIRFGFTQEQAFTSIWAQIFTQYSVAMRVGERLAIMGR
jgi:hypothetical protein